MTEEEYKSVIAKLHERGVAVATGDYFKYPGGRGLPVDICDRCGCLVDASKIANHRNLCREPK